MTVLQAHETCEDSSDKQQWACGSFFTDVILCVRGPQPLDDLPRARGERVTAPFTTYQFDAAATT